MPVVARFVSDLHLDGSRPEVTRLFVSMLETMPSSVRRLFILGDLFEAWIGDDAVDETADEIARSLNRLHAQRGVDIAFIRGNRDFLLGRDFSSRAGMRLLPDHCFLNLGGIPTLLMHGDTLCTDDHEYQRCRAMVRAPDWGEHFLSMPIAERIAYAKKAREASQAHQQDLNREITDVNPESVADAFDRFSVPRIIHGHTHRPAIHREAHDGRMRERIVLGDWYEQGSMLDLYDDGHIELRELPSGTAP